MEDDILAMTRTGYVFGEQPWLRAAAGHFLGAEIVQALTEGTRPPLPPGPVSTPFMTGSPTTAASPLMTAAARRDAVPASRDERRGHGAIATEARPRHEGGRGDLVGSGSAPGRGARYAAGPAAKSSA